MTNDPRYVHSQLRYGSTNINPETCPKSSILHARITEKKLELENLRQLRDLSAALAEQMQTLEEKLATLSDGTEGISSWSIDDEGSFNIVKSSCCNCIRELA